MKNTGIPYEKFVQDLMQSLFDAGTKKGQINIKVEHNKTLTDKNGVDRQFDIYWKYELDEITYETVIECKDYASKISIEKVDALIGKLADLPNVRGLFATTEGYQSGAEMKAKNHNIELLLIRKLNDSDFTDKDGNPLIRGIVVNMRGILPAEILEFLPIADRDWLEKNSDFDLSKPIQCPACFETEILINDLENNEKYSYRDLRYKLQGEKNVEIKESKSFKNAFLEYPNGLKFKLAGYNIKYIIPNCIESKVEVSADDVNRGVIEYLSTGTKKMIGVDGSVKTIKK